ncbi:MAG: hypothetical protein U1E45_04540 [Geminicoccaceae bacterium]
MRERILFESRHFKLSPIAPWKIWLFFAAAGAVGVALLVLAASVFLVAVPVLLGAGIVAKLLAGNRAPAPAGPTGRPGVIEGRYEVIDVGDRR